MLITSVQRMKKKLPTFQANPLICPAAGRSPGRVRSGCRFPAHISGSFRVALKHFSGYERKCQVFNAKKVEIFL
ncbi:hypothetical protein [Oscillospiraceae bacterium]|nr:hypothetical protein [Oscillospiraceae bacterium]